MPKSYPNQNIITCQKSAVKNDFLQINNSEWIAAARDLTASGFKFYLYLASNKPGFELALSKQYVMSELDISEGTYKKLVPELVEKGYLIPTTSNHFDFVSIKNYTNN